MTDTETTVLNGNNEGEIVSSVEKTFTQDQLNAIVGERLAKEKAKSEAAAAQREQELAQREFMLSAREKLTEKGYSAELVDALNCKDESTFAKSLSLIEKYFSKKGEAPIIKGATPYGGARAQGGTDIRGAMGLK